MAATDSVLVIGAGPAGLSAAIALRQAGVERVEVIESSDGQHVIGSELALQGPTLRALDSLGVADDCAALGVGIGEFSLCAQDGTVLHRQVLPPAHRAGLPPMVGITRPALLDALAARARAVGASVRLGVTVASLESASATGEVVLSDGSSDRFGLIVGADGVDSETRHAVLPQSEAPFYVGQACWRARVPRADIPATLVSFYGPKAKPGLITVSEEHAYVFCTVTVPVFERVDRDRLPELMREVLEPFGGLIAQVSGTITNPDHIHYSPLTPVIVRGPWHAGRVVLIGDAVHATTPHLAYGAGLAIEDGVVLGEEIAARGNSKEALQAFRARRFERCRMVVENGVQLSRWEQNPDAPGVDHAGLIAQSQLALSAPI